MSRISKIGASVILLISAWLMVGIGYTTKMGHPINTVLFIGGIVFCFIGFIWLIISITSTKKLRKK